MMGDSPDLEDRAAAIADMIALGMSPDTDEVMQLGVDLLVAGSDGPAVVALASVHPGSRWVDIEPVARAAFAEVSVDLRSLLRPGGRLLVGGRTDSETTSDKPIGSPRFCGACGGTWTIRQRLVRSSL